MVQKILSISAVKSTFNSYNMHLKTEKRLFESLNTDDKDYIIKRELLDVLAKKEPYFFNYLLIENVYDEYFAESEVDRKVIKPLVAAIKTITLSTLHGLHHKAKQSFKERGITYKVYSQQDSQDNIFPFDLLPRVVSTREWDKVERGLKQRIQALNAFLGDIYGKQKIIKNKRIPASYLDNCQEFYASLKGTKPAGGVYVHIAGCDLIRNSDGVLHVLEDNLRTPSGVSYLLENRITMKALVPDWFEGLNVHDVAEYPDKLHRVLQSFLSAQNSDPLIVVLTPGIYNSAYFEHEYLAKRMNCPLVENNELFVEKSKVYWLSPVGKKRVDVIYKRTDDNFLDPTYFKKDSLLGIPGIVEAYKLGNVVIANALGNGIADDKGIYHYVPEMIKYYLDEEIILPQITTYLGANKDDCAFMLAHTNELVVKLVNQSGGYGMLIGPQATKAELEIFRKKIKQSPQSYIAQPLIQISTIPTLRANQLHPHRVDWRVFVLSGLNDTWVLPGGLTRVALQEGSYVVNSSQGGGSKDTWVLKNK